MRQHKWSRDLTHYMVQLRRHMDTGHRAFTYNPSQQGAINCAIFGAEVAKIQDPDIDLPQALEGYTDGLSAAAKITRDEGVKDLHGLLAKYFHEKPVVMAHRGDLVLVEASESLGGLFPVGICMAEPPHYWGVTVEGLGYGPLNKAVACFAVVKVEHEVKVSHRTPLWDSSKPSVYSDGRPPILQPQPDTGDSISHDKGGSVQRSTSAHTEIK